jgi:hypothetical protein
MISNTEQTPEEHKNNKCQITHTLFKMDFTTDATSTPPEKDTSFRNYSGALQKKMLSAQLLKGRWNSIFCFSTQWYFYLKVICDETLWARGLRNKS